MRRKRLTLLAGVLTVVCVTALTPFTAGPGSATTRRPAVPATAATGNPDPSNAPLPLLELGTPVGAQLSLRGPGCVPDPSS